MSGSVDAVVWLPKHGLSWLEKLAIVSGLIVILIGLGIIIWVPTLHPGHLTPAPDVIGIVALLVVGAVTGFVLFWLRVPRAVGISQSGIILAYPFRKVRYPWNDLMNVLEVSHDMVTFNPLSYNPKKQVGSDMISYAQARIILADPRCPRVWMRDDQRRLIMESQPAISPR